jgi:tRNA threonylcarbamoyladenosine biosynthesis protein TsaE
MSKKIPLANEAATIALGQTLAATLKNTGAVIYLYGDLGAGKTTLSRGIIQSLGHTGNVKSPTYTLVEPYELEEVSAYHFDLYRLADPEELEFMGIRDYLNPSNVLLVEWPDKGENFIPAPDITIHLSYDGEGRIAHLTPHTPKGEQIIET